jgi:dihydrofolate synthase/folylpolyglutamate synthase
MHFEALKDWLHWQESLHPKAIDLGLERVARVYKALNPEQLKPATIIVAGTNGKGSCIAFLEAIYTAAGYRVGSYTSPHILKYNERIKIAGEPVTDDAICESFSRIEAVRDDTSLSYFEFGTLAALDIFWRSNLDIQLLEVGLGGRLDAVNIIDADIAIVSTICIDHADWLGETRAAIGKEKAGVFRAGIPAIIGDPTPPDSLLASAVEKQAIIYAFGQAFNYSKTSTSWEWHENAQIKLSNLPELILKGEQQYRNASTAIMSVMLMQNKLPVSADAFNKGLMRAHLTGRFQLINDKIPVLLDVAHNPQAVRMLVASLEQNFPDKRIHAVFTMMKDKDIKGVVELMQPHVVAWFVAPLKHSRIAEESLMKTIFQEAEIANVSFGFVGFDEAFSAAQANAEQEDLILIFGSFFLVSAYLARRNED